MYVQDKRVLITGGANGLGFATAMEIMRNGAAQVAILDLETSCGQESVDKLISIFGKSRAIFVPCDVSKESDFEAAFVKAFKEFGRLDIVINNAGVASVKSWESMVGVNVNGVINGTQLGFKYLGKDKGYKGAFILNIASIFGLDNSLLSPIYAATKHAVVGLSKSFGTPYYYDKTGVEVVCLCPGITHTQMTTDMKMTLMELVDPDFVKAYMKDYKWQNPEDVARGLINVIESAKNGSVWVIEGGEPAFEVSTPNRFALKV